MMMHLHTIQCTRCADSPLRGQGAAFKLRCVAHLISYRLRDMLSAHLEMPCMRTGNAGLGKSSAGL